jgi:putative ABC transport system substrate-binding protein
VNHAVQRRRILLAVGAASWLVPQQRSFAEGKLPRIGFLSPLPPNVSLEAGLGEGLSELGYIEGSNILIERRHAHHADEELLRLAQDLVQVNVDIMVTLSSQAARAAVAATKKIPVVFTLVGDPVATGLVSSLAKPGANATGVSLLATELAPKRLDILRQLAPRTQQVVHIINLGNPSSAQQVAPLRAAAKALGIKLDIIDVRNPRELEATLRASAWRAADAMLIGGDTLFVVEGAKIAQAVRHAKIPAIFPWRDFHEYGVLISYGPALKDVLRRGAYYVDKILRGAKPSDLPVEQVSKFDLVVNLRLAQSMRITVPQELLYRADEVFR